MQKQRAPVSLFFVPILALTLQGCAVKRWFFGPRAAPGAIPEPAAKALQASPSAPAAASDSPASLQWDFAQRTGAEKTPEPPQAPSQTARATLLASKPPTPPARAGSSGPRSWIPGLTDGKDESESNPQYVTEADLLKVVTEFQRLAGKDTYRKHPGAYPEILAFTRGHAYEGLHEYEKAIAQYQVVSQSKNRLNAAATKAIAVLTQFQEIKQRPFTASTPVAYLQALDSQIAAWQELQKQQADTPYEALAREEEERLDRAKVTFLELNRHRLEDGNESVVLAYRQLIGKHKESKNIYRYQIEFADFYFTLAQEYVAQNDPQSLQFDPSIFEDLGRTALRLYGQVAHEDGVMEKLEAKGKLEALEAYMAKVGRLGR